jgi:hypothetical protein
MTALTVRSFIQDEIWFADHIRVNGGGQKCPRYIFVGPVAPAADQS